MSWCALDVWSKAEERDAVAAWLVGRTGQAVEEREDGTLVGFAGSAPAADALRFELTAVFPGKVTASTRALPEIDWRVRWKEGLGPRRIGRLLITPSWTVPTMAAPADAVVVIIDPETAFGTAEHGSTRAALALLERRVTAGNRVLDLGSGSGILAITAARLGAARAVGVDVDPETEPVARANAVRNGVAGRVSFLIGAAEDLAQLLGPADLVLSNILRSANEALLPTIRAALAPGGAAIFAGMETPERETFCEALARAGWLAQDEATDDAWWAVAARPG